MAGRPHKIRSIQSYINNIDAHTYSGPMKIGTAPSVGVTRTHWHNYQTQCYTKNQVKKRYDNLVFLNVNPAQTHVTTGFRSTTNSNYNYNGFPNVKYYDSNAKFNNHFYRPYNRPHVGENLGKFINPSNHMTGFISRPI